MRALPSIRGFFGEYRFLSNFWHSPFGWEGKTYDTAEHAFQASKTTDLHWKRRIVHAETPGKAKRLGRQVPIIPNWDKIRVEVMRSILTAKFSVPYLRECLLATKGRELVEANTWGDVFWGQCGGRGQNMLGKLLMAIRDTI